MYHTAKVDKPEYFRAGFSQFMLVMISIIVQDIHNMGGQCEVGKYPLSPSTVKCVRVCMTCQSLIMFLVGTYLPWNGI